MPLQSNERTLPIAIIASVAILTALLAIVIICWIGTYMTMKKKIRALQLTTVTGTTAMPTTGNR
jgi:cell division protein FtsN